MAHSNSEKQPEDQLPKRLLDLMLDLVLDVMKAERGSVMLVDPHSQELSIQSARGLNDEIVRNARVRLGTGIAGKVASSGQATFLKGKEEEHRHGIDAEDLKISDIDTSYILPLKLHDKTLGVLNISSVGSQHAINLAQEPLVRGIIQRFVEYICQAELPVCNHEAPSQVYMMNVFREFNTLRELRIVFDYIFHLVTELLSVKKKGIFLLNSQESGFFDLVLGYGFDTHRYREIYEEIVPCLKSAHLDSERNVRVFSRQEFCPSPTFAFQEEFYVLLPLVLGDDVQGQIILFADDKPEAGDFTKQSTLKSILKIAARTIRDSAVAQKFHEMTLTDSLTGTYNYGLWWKRLHEECARARRLDNNQISLIVFDIDQFDIINRNYGFLFGDELLRVIADHMKNCVRLMDVVGRIGGEEFGLILPGAAKRDASKVANRILSALPDLTKEMRIQISERLALSGGVATFPEDAEEAGKLVEKAKTALLSAKIMGGNRVKCFESLEE